MTEKSSEIADGAMAEIVKRKKSSEIADGAMALLPTPILANIFSRVSFKSNLDCKSLCKAFYESITADSIFFGFQFNRSPPELLLCHRYMKKMMLIDIDSEGDRACELNFSLDHIAMNSCSGLLCLHASGSPDVIYVINPFTLEYIEIDNIGLQVNSYSYKEEIVSIWIGLGFSVNSKEYKLLAVVQIWSYVLGKTLFEIEIVTLQGLCSWRSWRTLKCPNLVLDLQECFSTYVNGYLHWVMKEQWLGRRTRQFDRMTYFDIENETFGYYRLPAPFNLSKPRRNVSVLSLIVFEGLLTLSILNEELSVSVWVMNVYGDSASWNNRITVDVRQDFAPENIRCFFPVRCIYRSESTDQLMIYFLDNVLFTFDHRDNLILKKNEFSSRGLSKAFIIVPIHMPFKNIVEKLDDATVVHTLRPKR